MTENPLNQPQITETQPSSPQKPKRSLVPIVALLLVCLLVGIFIGYAVTFSVLDGRINQLQSQLQNTQGENFEQGILKSMNGDDLVLWIRMISNNRVNITLK